MPYYLDSEKFLEENVKYINNLTGRKPIILPIILDIKRDKNK